MSKEEEHEIIYLNLPIQLVSGSNPNDIVYHNVLLKKLPDGNYAIDPNQIIVQDDIVTENSENYSSDYQVAADSINLQFQKDVHNTEETISSSNERYKNYEQKFSNEILETVECRNDYGFEDKSTFSENYNQSKSHKLIECKPGVRYYQNKKQFVPKGPGRPRKDGLVKPRIERMGPFKCSFCNKEFDLYAELRKHEKQHVQEKSYQCSKCSASFNLMCNYRLHMATHEKELHACPECHKTFNRQASLRAHLMLHCVDDNLICIKCGTSIETQALLDQHKKTCNDEKYYPGTEKTLPSISSPRFCSKITNQKRKQGNKLSCTVCKKSFKKPSQLERHVRIHTGEKPYKCNICNRGFSQKGSLIIHRVKHSGIRPYSCPLCPATFAQKGNLQAHQSRVHPSNLEHIKKDTTKTIFACQKCSCVFKRLGSLNSHMNKLHSASTSSSTENSALNDIKSVMNQLSELQNMTSGKDILHEAVKNSGLDKKFPATQSAQSLEEQKTNSSNSSMNKITVFDNLYGDKLRCYVVKQRKVGGIKWRQCNYCTREFRKPSDLIRHLRIHTKEKPFKCSQCFRRFTVKSTLTAHMKTHAGLKTFMCSICQKLFSSVSSLKVHIRLHTGIKPFKCQICEKTFRTSGMLQTHRASKCHSHIHQNAMDQTIQQSIEIEEQTELNSGEMSNYFCTTCGRIFHNATVLKAHLKTHSAMKPFKCLVNNCSMLFKTMASLKLHTEKHSEIKSYICPYCQKTFKTKANSRRHIKLHKEGNILTKSTMNLNTTQQVFSETLENEFSVPTHLIITSNNDIIINENEKNITNISAIDENHEQNFDSVNVQNINVLPISNCIVVPKNLNVVNKSGNCLGDRIILDNSGNIYQVSEILQSEMKLVENSLIQNDTVKNNECSSAINDNITFSNNDIDRNNLNLFPSNDRPTLVVPTKTLISDNVNAYVDLRTNEPQENNSSYLCNNLQYSTQSYNEILNSAITVQNDVECKENSNKLQTEGVVPNTFFKKLMLNFQNQFDILCLEGQENSLGVLEQENCMQNVQEFNSENSEVINLQTQVEEPHDIQVEYDDECGDNIQSVDFNYESGDSTQQIIQCDNIIQKDRLEEDNQHTEDIILVSPEGDNIVKASEQCFDINYPSHVEKYNDIHIEKYNLQGTLEISSEHVNDNQPDEGDPDSNKHLRCKTKSLSISEQAFLDYVYKQHKEATLNKVAQYPNKCNYCVKSFKKPSDLTRHIRVHTGEKPFSCDICHKKFSLKTSLDCHMVTHNKPNKTIVCSVCNSSFSTKGSLKVHMRLHTGSRPFECPLCEMTFRTSGHKRAHLLVHYRGAFKEGKDPKDIITKGNKILNIMGPLTSNLYKFSQDTQSDNSQSANEFNLDESTDYYCNKEDQDNQLPNTSFEKSDKDNIALKDNVVTNLNSEQALIEPSWKKQVQERLYKQQCKICNKTFKKPSQLSRHQLIHTGEKPYQCNICSKAFNQKNGLATHMRHHTGLRPHECPHCSKSFSQKGNLKTHISRAHGTV